MFGGGGWDGQVILGRRRALPELGGDHGLALRAGEGGVLVPEQRVQGLAQVVG
jgi:hypothetical protein